MKKKSYGKICGIFIALCVLSVGPLLAQKVAATKGSQKKSPLLPIDPNVRTGKLPNGFTYFIRHSENPKNRVVLYLANKVGSVLENDDQQGLAHFMEHMNFNGTTHFPKNQLIDYLQKAGVRFGADINAYTSFDETVYQLPIASDKRGLLDTGLLIMHDWAQGALLDPIEINKERGVVLEEKRLGKGVAQRMQQQYIPVLFNRSRYGQRIPIGQDSVLNNFKPETIRKFFNDWYRPDLQALIVVGDVDINKMEKNIREKFADLINPKNERPHPTYTIDLNGKNQFIALTDKEQTTTAVQVLVKQKGVGPIKTEKDLKNYMVANLFNSMLANRYSDLTEQKGLPYLAGTAGIGPFLGGLKALSIKVTAKPGELEAGFKCVWREIEKLKRFGFTETELNRAKKILLHNEENSFKQLKTAYSQKFVEEYLDCFLKGNAIPGIEKEYPFTEQKLPEITLADVDGLLNQYNTDINRDIIIIAPDQDKAKLPDEATIEKWMTDVHIEKLEPYKDDMSAKVLLSSKPVSGKIAKEIDLKAINAKEYILSNGARVIIKPEEFIANDVLFKAFSPGGTSLYSDKDYQSAIDAAVLTTKAGLGDFNFTQLQKYLKGTSVFSGVYIGEYDQGIQAAAAPGELETLLQMTYLYFTKPKKDSIAFNNFIAMQKNALLNRDKNPNTVFQDTMSAVLSNYNFRSTPNSLAKLSAVNLDRSLEIFKESFADASNFTFTFVGDFDPEKLKPLIEKYLASLPSTHQNKQAKDLDIHPVSGKITKTVYKGIEDKANVRLTFSGNYDYSTINNMNFDALAEVLQIRLIERLREDESGVYTPGITVSRNKVPSQRYEFTIIFGCAPKNVDKLVASALDEVNKLKNSGPLTVNLEKFKAESRNKHETDLRKIDFWSIYFYNQILNNESLYEVNNYDANMLNITSESIKATAQKYLSGDNLIRLILMPEK